MSGTQSTHTQPVSAAQGAPVLKPIELVAKEERLANLVIYRKDLEAIISRLEGLIPPPAKVVVTATIDGQAVTQFSDDFMRRTDLPTYVRDIKLNITNSAQPFAKTIVVVISTSENSRFFVNSDDGVWTNGAYAALRALMGRYSSWMGKAFQRYGLNLNGIIFLAALIMLPSLRMTQRLIFMIAVILLLLTFKKIHDKINRPTVYFDGTTQWALAREYPSILSTVLASALVGAAGWVFSILNSGALLDAVIGFLKKIAGQ